MSSQVWLVLSIASLFMAIVLIGVYLDQSRAEKRRAVRMLETQVAGPSGVQSAVPDLREEQLQVVMPPVDMDRFHPPAEPVEEPVAAFISPLATNKGIDRILDAYFAAVVEAAEESVLNSVFGAPTVTGRDDNTSEGIPADDVLALLASHGRR